MALDIVVLTSLVMSFHSFNLHCHQVGCKYERSIVFHTHDNIFVCVTNLYKVEMVVNLNESIVSTDVVPETSACYF